MKLYRLTPQDLGEYPALGLLLLLREGLNMARLALLGTHAELLEDEESFADPHAAAAFAYATALMSEMRTLEETIQSYRFALQHLSRGEELEEEAEEDLFRHTSG